MKTKVCTKCGKEKPMRSFGKLGKKRNPRCKECVNEYQRSQRHSNKYSEDEQEKITIDIPVFAKQGKYKGMVQRTQMVVLSGEAEKFILITCPCGLQSDLEYKHSYDQNNDYYEGKCSVCGKAFKLNVVNK